MKYLVKKGEMQQYDTNTMDVFGMPSLVLIERAAMAAVEELGHAGLKPHSRILIACGTGNNGADGLVMARLLHLDGHMVQILLIGDRKKATAENQAEVQIAQNYGIPILSAQGAIDAKMQMAGASEPSAYDLVIDAIFGVGLSRSIEGLYAQLIERLNQIPAKKAAVDIPSGLDADSGCVLGVAFRADLTVTFSYEKLGMRLFPGQEYCGQIVCRSVGIDDRSFLAETGRGHAPLAAALTDEDLALIPDRRMRTNKGSYGKVLVIAGSINMAGAALFSARAAYLCGCGLVRVLTPEENRTIIQSVLPEAVLTTYDHAEPDAEVIKAAMQWADVIVCGPGLGMSDGAHRIVQLALEHAAVPLVLDADALNIVAEDVAILNSRSPADLIVTPHLGEMARLQRIPVFDIQNHLVKCAQELAQAHRLICVLKDARTVTALPSGQTYVNLSGNHGMATGGSGDVLTGVIAALIAQGASPELAAPLGVYIHGLAGDAAAETYGHYSMTASALLAALPEIFLRKEGKK